MAALAASKRLDRRGIMVNKRVEPKMKIKQYFPSYLHVVSQLSFPPLDISESRLSEFRGRVVGGMEVIVKIRLRECDLEGEQ